MRSHYFSMGRATWCCFVFLLSFVLGVNCQSEAGSSLSSSESTKPPPSNTGVSVSSTASGVSYGVSGTSTGTADFPTLSGYSDCVTNCFAIAVASSDCPSLTASDCYCNSTNVEGFKQSIISCLTDDCVQELLTGEQLAQMFCKVGPSGTSISFPPVPSSLSSVLSSSLSSTLSSPTPTRTSGGDNSNGGTSSWWSAWGVGGSTVVCGILVGLASIFAGTVSW